MKATELGEMLRHRRHATGMTQRQLADMVGVHETTIWRWEQGNGLDPVVAFFRLLERTGTRVSFRKARRSTNRPT